MDGFHHFFLLQLLLCFQLLILPINSFSAAVDGTSDPYWHPALASWYGSPEGDGSDGIFFLLFRFLAILIVRHLYNFL